MASPESVAYVFGTGHSTLNTTLDTAGVSFRGDPIALWAGPISVAAGLEWRRESIGGYVDALSDAKQFRTLNLAPLQGSFSVREGFAEAAVPVLSIPNVSTIELNGAARYSDYSTTGSIWSWKLGATGRLFDSLLLRAVRSRDIRSASLTELFTQVTTTTAVIADPVTNTSAAVFRYVGGNKNLLPEIGVTTTVGASFSPKAVKGLNLSVDYYSIDISDVITTLSAQEIVTGCANGNVSLCSLVTRNSANQITEIQAPYINVARYKTRGIDFEASYILPIDRLSAGVSGNLKLRVLATRVISLSIDDGRRVVERAGDVGDINTFNSPKWRGSGSITYENSSTILDARVRYVGGGVFDSQLDISNNSVDSSIYLDLAFQQRVGKLILFGGVTNVLDKQPPLTTYRSPFYDAIGRYFNMGATVKF